ncbi:hypothetical protein C0585_06180 [Candidatus Woesearchaeota archaeon]|nr:MAG: hypothetical protein C0585_06180 [Candidatus Woesearchaeota archaeon]
MNYDIIKEDIWKAYLFFKWQNYRDISISNIGEIQNSNLDLEIMHINQINNNGLNGSAGLVIPHPKGHVLIVGSYQDKNREKIVESTNEYIRKLTGKEHSLYDRFITYENLEFLAKIPPYFEDRKFTMRQDLVTVLDRINQHKQEKPYKH